MIKKVQGVIQTSCEKIRMAEQSFMVFLAILIGVLGGFGSLAVRYMIDFFTGLSYRRDWDAVLAATKDKPWYDTALTYFNGVSHHTQALAVELPWYEMILVPAIGGLIIGPIIYFFAREAKGHGVPEVMEAVVKREGVIRPRVVLVKAIASSICIGSGGSTGREGPIVQIGASIGSAVGQFLKLQGNKVKTLVACGAAAGIAATFNAPIAGALFAVEIILGDFGVAQFSPIVISSVVATVVSHQLSGGDFPTFKVPEGYELTNLTELIPFAVLGLLGAIAAVTFIKILYKSEDLFDKIPIPAWIKPAMGGLVLGVVALSFPQILGTGHETLNAQLNFLKPGAEIDFSNWSWYLMMSLVVLKMVGTSLTLGSGGSGGIFAPSLFIGAMLGGGFGVLTQAYFPEYTGSSGAFPMISMLVAMGAMVSAATHAPITAILIVFELTNYNYHMILPLMLASIISTLFARRLKKESIYTEKLIRRGVNIEAGHEVNVLKSMKVREVMGFDKQLIPGGTKLMDIMESVVNSSHSCFVVVKDDGEIMGSFALHDFKTLLSDFEDLKDLVIAENIANPHMIFVKEEDNLDYVMNQFVKGNTDELPVLDADEKEVIGTVWRNDVINAYNHGMLKAEMASGVAKRISTIEQHSVVEVIPGYSLVEIPVPKTFVGQTLMGINVRAKYLVSVILIRKQGEPDSVSGEIRTFPYGDYVFKDKDRLLIFGENAMIERIKKL